MRRSLAHNTHRDGAHLFKILNPQLRRLKTQHYRYIYSYSSKMRVLISLSFFVRKNFKKYDNRLIHNKNTSKAHIKHIQI